MKNEPVAWISEKGNIYDVLPPISVAVVQVTLPDSEVKYTMSEEVGAVVGVVPPLAVTHVPVVSFQFRVPKLALRYLFATYRLRMVMLPPLQFPHLMFSFAPSAIFTFLSIGGRTISR